VAVMQNMHTRIDFNDIENLDLDESQKFNIVLSKSNSLSDETMLDCKKQLEAQANANVEIHLKNNQNLLAADNSRTLDVLIHAPVRFELKFLEYVLRVFIETDTTALYSDFKIENNGVIESIKLPAWSPIRYESIDYLGPVIVVDLDKLQLDPNDPKSRQSIIQKSLEGQKRISRLPRYSYICEMWEASINPLEIPSAQPDLISIIIPTQGLSDEKGSLLERCLNSLAKQKVDSCIEVIVVADTSFEPEIIRKSQELVQPNWMFKLIEFTEPFNFSRKCNVGASEANGTALLFLNDDVEVLSEDVIARLAELSLLDGVGAVGSQLKFSDGSIQHGGITLQDLKPRNSYQDQFPHPTVMGDLEVAHEVSGVTGACLAISKSSFAISGGWNEDLYNSYNDVDLCLRLNNLGLQTVVRNDLEILHHESVTRDARFDEESFGKLKLLWPTDLGNEQYLRSPEALGIGYQGTWGIERESRVDLSGKYFQYFLHLLTTQGLIRTIYAFSRRISGKTSNLLRSERKSNL
jgi:GT2 family glycosyltransferase